jgi:glucose-6-phosphate 1-dehydrogenase
VDPVLGVWASERDFIPTHPAGAWEPAEAGRIFTKAHHAWRQWLDPR